MRFPISIHQGLLRHSSIGHLSGFLFSSVNKEYSVYFSARFSVCVPQNKIQGFLLPCFQRHGAPEWGTLLALFSQAPLLALSRSGFIILLIFVLVQWWWGFCPMVCWGGCVCWGMCKCVSCSVILHLRFTSVWVLIFLMRVTSLPESRVTVDLAPVN